MTGETEKTPYAAVIGNPRKKGCIDKCVRYFGDLKRQGVLGKAQTLLPSQNVVLRETFEASRAFRNVMGDDEKLWSIVDNWLNKNSETRRCPAIVRARVLDLERCTGIIAPFKKRDYGLDFKLYPSSFDDGN